MALTGRAICNIGFVERPLVLGLCWWALTGEASPALPLAVFFELFWLDLYPIGSFIPPMPAFPYLLLLALSRSLGWNDSSTIAFPLAMSLPLAYVIPRLEFRLRNYHRQASDILIQRVREPQPLGSLPGTIIRASLVYHLGLGMLLFLILYAAIFSLFSFPLLKGYAGHLALDVDWPVLYVLAAAGALLSLRIKKAYLVFSIAMLTVLLLQFH